jgi:uncharacterized protein YbjT (DUF2867 family)
MIVVTGATGNAGSEVVRALTARGSRVRAFVRDPGKARDKLGENVELAVGDFADPSSVRASLEGADALLLSCADDPRRVGWETAAIDAAAAAGVRRIVKLSAAPAEPGSPVAFWDWHGQVEQYLRASGAEWVILRSGWYMSNLLAAASQVAAEGRLYAPAGQAQIAMIDPRDVGAAAATVLSQVMGPAQAMRGKPTSSPDPARSPMPRWPPDCPRRQRAGWSSSMFPATPRARP